MANLITLLILASYPTSKKNPKPILLLTAKTIKKLMLISERKSNLHLHSLVQANVQAGRTWPVQIKHPRRRITTTEREKICRCKVKNRMRIIFCPKKYPEFQLVVISFNNMD